MVRPQFWVRWFKMVSDLDKLMALNGGATAAGQFTPTGELVAHRGGLYNEHAGMVAMMCAANTIMGKCKRKASQNTQG